MAYSNARVRLGLITFSITLARTSPFSVLDAKIPIEKRIQAVDSIRSLYKDCLEPRCAPLLSHLDEPGANPLTAFATCYGM